MKIVHIIFALNIGGTETMLVDIINEQVEKANVSLIVINRNNNNSLCRKIDKRIKVYFLNRKEGSRNILYIVKLNLTLYKIKANVIHCHNHNIIPMVFPPLRKKTILSLHCIGIPIRYLKKYRKLYSISNSVRNDIYNRSNIESVVIYNGIRTDLIQKKSQISISDTFKIVQIGRLDHDIKGQHLAIKAINQLRLKGIENIQLDFIGIGESEEFLKDLVHKFDLGDKINFLGLKDRTYIYSQLMNYDLLIQPSLNEGFGLVITEAMAAKVPVLISDIDGPMEIIENGKYGFFFKSGDAIALEKQLVFIIKNYNLRMFNSIINAAYLCALDKFDVCNSAKSYMHNYL